VTDSPIWEPDVLPGYESLTLPLQPDDEGEVVATLVRRAVRDDEDLPDVGVDLLYVHGWVDYFFQTHLAEFWERLGVRFYALDLRKYGRSIRPYQTPGYVTSLRTYDEDIEAALTVIGHGEGADGRSPARKLIVMGHSTGGLILSLWAANHQDRLAGVVLNSPWLEFQTREVGRKVLEPGIRAHAALAPRSHLVNVDQGFYVRSVSSRYDGGWEYNSAWRPDTGWRPTPAWLAAIFRGHERVAHGLGINAPVLVLLSTRSTPPVRWTDDMMWTDSVLDVVGIARRVPDLGHLVTLARIDGALHDVTLSAPEVRDVVWRETARWFHGYVAPPPPPPPDPPPAPAGPPWPRWLDRLDRLAARAPEPSRALPRARR